MSTKKSPEAVSLEDLERASGGATQTLFSQVNVGLNPSHNYGMLSDPYGAGTNLQFDRANESLQRFNAPTHDGLYGPQGNDPSLTEGTVARPGANYLPETLQHGGNVTLFHGDGYIINTTVAGQHMLEGTASRHLVVDLNEGGGYQTLTLGQGQNGAQLAQATGGALFGSTFGPLIGQNMSHALNPGLGEKAFPSLDAAQKAWVEGTPNPNLNAPQGIIVEGGGVLHSAVEAYKNMGEGQINRNLSESDAMVRDVGRQLNQDGPVHGYFEKSSLGGVYLQGPEGTRYFERGEDGKVVEKQVDPFGGVDRAMDLQAAKNMLPGDPIYQTGEIMQQQAATDAANAMLAGDPIQQMGEIQQQQRDLEAANAMLAGDPIQQMGEIQQQQRDLDAANAMLAGDPIQQMGEIQQQQADLDAANAMLAGDPIQQMGEIQQQQADLDAANAMLAGDPIQQMGEIQQQQADLDAANAMLAGDPIQQMGEIQQQQADLDAANAMLAGDPIQQMGDMQQQQSFDYNSYEPASYTPQSFDTGPSYTPPSMDYQSPYDTYSGLDSSSSNGGYDSGGYSGGYDSGGGGYSGGYDSGGYSGGYDSGGGGYSGGDSGGGGGGGGE